MIARSLAVLIVLLAFTSSAWADQRVALVIGNSSYHHVARLPNPGNDASDIANVLKRIGFSVTKVHDLSFDAMRRTLRDFSERSSRSNYAVVFYAGHGIEINKQNYLIPVDAQLKRDRDIEFEAIPLDLVMNAVSGANVLRLVMLDSCRINPFAASMQRTSSQRSIGRGLARIEPSTGTLVSYAARAGTIADDGKGRNSPYTQALLANIARPGLEVNFLFREVRDKVLDITEGKQEPFTYGSLPAQQLFLSPHERLGKDSALRHLPFDRAVDREAVFWSSISNTTNLKLLQSYLAKFPDGLYAPIARAKMVELKSKMAGLQPAQQNDTAVVGATVDQDISQLERQAKVGDRGAAFRLAERYAWANGVAHDYKAAFLYYKMAAEAGHAEAQLAVASALEAGRGTKQNIYNSASWYHVVSELNKEASFKLKQKARRRFKGLGYVYKFQHDEVVKRAKNIMQNLNAAKSGSKRDADVFVYVPAVVGASGDGGQALTLAVSEYLSTGRLKVFLTPVHSAHTVQGVVALGSPKNSKQSITINWNVLDPSGKSLGDVSQKNEIPAGSLDSKWGETAYAAALAASNGILELLPKP